MSKAFWDELCLGHLPSEVNQRGVDQQVAAVALGGGAPPNPNGQMNISKGGYTGSIGDILGFKGQEDI